MLNLSLSSNRDDKRVEALQRIESILLQGISLHSFRFDSDESARFQSGIRDVRARLGHADDEDTAILLAASAVRMMEEHSEAVAIDLHNRHDELEKVIALLAEALLEIGHASPEVMIRVKELERDIAAAPTAAALAPLRCSLNGCVNGIKEKVADLMTGHKAIHVPGKTDAVTGLPNFGFAEQAMSAIWDDRENYYIGMFAVERLESINARFGFKAGDEILLMFSQYLTQHVAAKDQSFRWRGPCLLLLMQRDWPQSVIASELARTAGHRIDHALAIGDREVLVSITTSFKLFPLSAATNLEEIVSDLNAFALSRGTPGPSLNVSGPDRVPARRAPVRPPYKI